MLKYILDYLRFRREAILAEAALLERYIEALERGSSGSEIGLCEFNPAWKRGVRLTAFGRQAVRHAFDIGMRQSEVARLFRISLKRAHALHEEWLALQQISALGQVLPFGTLEPVVATKRSRPPV